MKDIKGYEGLYAITEEGKVWSYPREWIAGNRVCKHNGKFLSPGQHIQGYKFVSLMKKGVKKPGYIHRLVAQTYISNPKKLKQINHKNGNQGDNRIENLEWITDLENKKHHWARMGGKAISRREISVIMKLLASKWSPKRIGSLFGFEEEHIKLLIKNSR